MSDDDDVVMDNDYSFSNDQDVPAPDVSGIRVLTHRALVMPLVIKKKTAGKILIPDSARDAVAFLQFSGLLLAVGESFYLNTELGPNRNKLPEVVPQVGQFIIYRRNSGQRFEYRGVKLLWLAENDFMGIVADPESLRVGV